jgi:hypothetical protein
VLGGTDVYVPAVVGSRKYVTPDWKPWKPVSCVHGILYSKLSGGLILVTIASTSAFAEEFACDFVHLLTVVSNRIKSLLAKP